MRSRTAVVCDLDALPDLDGLYGVDTHDRLSQPSIESRIPAGVRTQAGRYAARDDLERAADRVAVLLRLFDFLEPCRSPTSGKNASDNLIVANGDELFPGCLNPQALARCRLRSCD